MKMKIVGAVIAAVLFVAGGAYYFGIYGANGTLKVNVTDPLPAGWSAVYVNVTQISIHNSTAGNGHGFAKSFSSPVELNLASAANKSVFLASLSLPKGHYQMIRLTLTGAYGVYEGKTFRITLVSSTVDIAGQFTIGSGSTTTVVLNFNSAQAIHGNSVIGFTMTPVVGMTVG